MTNDDPIVAIPGDGNVHVGQMSAADVTALITVFQNMLDRSERRIIERLDQNSAGASERWALHEREHGAIDTRMAQGEAILTEHIAKSMAFYEKYHAEEIREAARLEPFKLSLAWVWANWRTILLLIVALVAILGFSGETLDRLSHTLFQ